MNNYQFLRDYQDLQYSIMFDKLIDLKFARIGYCKGDESGFWNLALTDQLLTQKQLLSMESTFKKLKRNPTVYFENKLSLKQLVDFLLANQYKLNNEDCWLFHSGENIISDRFFQIKKVNNDQELRIFLTVFDACYQKDDPQNPYGALGSYLKVVEKSWFKHHVSNRIEYFIAYADSQAVAVSTLTNFNQIGYISNVGSLRKVRGQGFGKLATLYCVDLSKKRGNKYHCLATEERTYPHEFYQRIGFIKKFSATYYTKAVK